MIILDENIDTCDEFLGTDIKVEESTISLIWTMGYIEIIEFDLTKNIDFYFTEDFFVSCFGPESWCDVIYKWKKQILDHFVKRNSNFKYSITKIKREFGEDNCGNKELQKLSYKIRIREKND